MEKRKWNCAEDFYFLLTRSVPLFRLFEHSQAQVRF